MWRFHRNGIYGKLMNLGTEKLDSTFLKCKFISNVFEYVCRIIVVAQRLSHEAARTLYGISYPLKNSHLGTRDVFIKI